MFKSVVGDIILKTYTCVRCNKQFQSNHRSAVCPNCKTGICIICGKEFNLQPPWTQKTCSTKCRGIYRQQSGIGKKAAQKSLNTKQMRYGTVNPHELYTGGIIKRCKWCGKEFEASDPRQEYCKDIHYGKCPICGKQVKITDFHQGVPCCSPKCSSIKTKNTVEKKYGSTCVLASSHGKEQTKKTCLEKYGFEHYQSSKEFQKQYKDIMNSKYGVDYPLQSETIKSAWVETNIEKYGTSYPMQNEEIKEKSRFTFQEKYRGIGFGSDVILDKINQTNQVRYGTIHPSKSEKIKDKIRSTCLSKYGVNNYKQSEQSRKYVMTDPTKIGEYTQFLKDPKKYIECNYDEKITIAKLCQDLGVTDTPIYEILKSHDCSYLIHSKMSSMEYELLEFFKALNIYTVHNTKKIIPPYELDLYLPDYKLAIECNPTVTHNSSFSDPWNQPRKSPSYHKMKTDMCESKNIQLFHIFGYEWAYRKEIIFSMLRNKLGNCEVLYGRNTYVCDVSYDECSQFLNCNHRQGNISAPIRLGLRLKSTEELVSVMTFGKIRNTIGSRTKDKDNCYELSRFCNKLNTSVVGGASKIFKYFLHNYDNIIKVISFSDRAHTSGNLYRILGFTEVSRSDPGYVWVDMKTDRCINRVNAQKRNLTKLLNDDSIDIETQSERQIMESHGYARVFDSGVIRWEYLCQ